MKKQIVSINMVALFAAAVLAGCGKQAEPNQTGPGAAQPATNTKSVGETLNEAAKPVVHEVEKAAKDVQTAATTAVDEATAKANTLIDQAKKLVSETKYSDAMNLINQLSSMKLTPEQQKLVTDLKAQVQKALSSLTSTNVSGAIGNLLK